MNKKEGRVRPFETRYFGDGRYKKDKYIGSRGFPKSESGSIDGAAKAVAKGYVRKVQCVDRHHGDKVLWTVVARPKVPGVKIVPYDVIRGDDERPSRRKEK